MKHQKSKPDQNCTVRSNNDAITSVEYDGFQRAYDQFNSELFGGALPSGILITLQRRGGSKGYFAPRRFSGRQEDETIHEIALNPATFADRTDEEICSTLVHEMVHAWQEAFGKPPRRCYHNKQWALRMEELGLMPSANGEPGGKRTGARVTHYIIEGGPFQRAYQKLAASGFQLHWNSRVDPAKTRNNSKTKYTCEICGQNAWAKPDADLICGHCEHRMQPATSGQP